MYILADKGNVALWGMTYLDRIRDICLYCSSIYQNIYLSVYSEWCFSKRMMSVTYTYISHLMGMKGNRIIKAKKFARNLPWSG